MIKSFIDAAFHHFRAVIFIFLVIIVGGTVAYIRIPKEAAPDVPIPFIFVSVAYEGIAPEDGEKLLLKPLEKELQGIDGLQEMTSYAVEGAVNVTLEFDPGFNNKVAIQDVREKVDSAQSEFPSGAKEPIIKEINIALFPILTINMSGDVPQSTLIRLAKDLSDAIEDIPTVLEAKIVGDREELLEIIVEPLVMETYKISYAEVMVSLSRNNRLVAAGAIDTGNGRFVLKVPAVLETIDDVMDYPIKTVGNRTVTFKDIATIRRTYKDPTNIARLNWLPTVGLEVSKRIGSNIIETVEATRHIVDTAKEQWGDNISVYYSQDESKQIRTMLSELQNNIITAVILVMMVIIAALGFRSSLVVGLAIPSSFLAGILILQTTGYTLNIISLFSLILVVGMLVDAAIIVVELAERYRRAGIESFAAYARAAKRMAMPVIASTGTTLAVFVPLLFWTGFIGKFMKFLPMMVIFTLGSSLFMALIFLPVIGGVIDRRKKEEKTVEDTAKAASNEGKVYDWYLRLLKPLLRHPTKSFLAFIGVVVGIYMVYGVCNYGATFFPDLEPEYAQVYVRARGDLSINERDYLVAEVERELLKMPEIVSVYTNTMGMAPGGMLSEDTIGIVQLELADWQERRAASEIFDEIRERVQGYAGVIIELHKEAHGPQQGKTIDLRFFSSNHDKLTKAVKHVEKLMAEVGGFEDIEDSLPLPGIEWRLEVDRTKAAALGADTLGLGNMVQVLTKGFKLTSYRPEDTDDEIDVNIRFPEAARNIESLRKLRLLTPKGFVPISNFVEFVPAVKNSSIRRVDGNRMVSIKANVREGLLVTEQLKTLLSKVGTLEGVKLDVKGQEEDQQEAQNFLMNAFIVALFLMMFILILQFNSFYQTILVLSAIICSTAGVLIGLLVTQQPLGIVMVGIALIALSGIVINNNIVLIDLYNQLIAEGLSTVDAVLQTCRRRLRPIFLTAITTVLGLLPMTLSLNIDFIEREVTFGAPSTQWWVQLSTAIVFGLSFATFITLFLTPVMLVLGSRVHRRFLLCKRKWVNW
jgi:multidrug efflux pump